MTSLRGENRYLMSQIFFYRSLVIRENFSIGKKGAGSKISVLGPSIPS